jgi:hypothetical protein
MGQLQNTPKSMKKFLSSCDLDELDNLYQTITVSEDEHAKQALKYIAAVYEKKLVKQVEKLSRAKTYQEKIIAGTIKPFQIVQSTWDVIKCVDYLQVSDYGSARNVLMCADMGTGKNFCRKYSREPYRLLAPLKSIVGQQGSGNQVKVDATTTYDQSLALLNLIEMGELRVQDEILIIDEAHNLLLADYRVVALNNVLKLLKYDWKQIIFQSATVGSDDFDSIIQFDEKIRAISNRKINLNYVRHHVPKLADQFEAAVRYIVLNPVKTIVLYNNKAKIEELAASLRELEMVVEIVDADRIKDTSSVAYQLAINDDFQMDHIDVLIGTTSLVEGISIQDDITHANAIVIGDTDVPPEHIKQLCGRFRKASTVNCLHLGANSLENRIADPDQWLAIQRQEAQFIAAVSNNLTTIYRQYDHSEHADWLKSTSFDFARNGIEFDPVNRCYIKSDISLLFDSSRCKTSQFYADFNHAANVMTDMGFTVQTANRSDSLEELQEIIRDNSQRVRMGLKAQRAKSAERFINIINQFFQDSGHVDYTELFLQLRDNGQLNFDKFQARIFEMLQELELEKLSTDDVLMAIQHMIKGKLNDKTIIRNTNARVSQFGIMHYLRKKYPSGTRLTVQEQKGILQCILEQLVNITQTANGCSSEEALQFILRQPLWRNVASKVALVNDKILLDSIERPSLVLKKFMPTFTSKSVKNANGTVNRWMVIL